MGEKPQDVDTTADATLATCGSSLGDNGRIYVDINLYPHLSNLRRYKPISSFNAIPFGVIPFGVTESAERRCLTGNQLDSRTQP